MNRASHFVSQRVQNLSNETTKLRTHRRRCFVESVEFSPAEPPARLVARYRVDVVFDNCWTICRRRRLQGWGCRRRQFLPLPLPRLSTAHKCGD